MDARVSMGKTSSGSYAGTITIHSGNNFTTDPNEVSGTLSGGVFTGDYDKGYVKWTFSDDDHFTGVWGGTAWNGKRFDESKRNACGCPTLLASCNGTAAAGAACAHDTDCCTGACGAGGDGGLVCVLLAGAACKSASECVNAHCESGLCCAGTDSDCYTNADCCGPVGSCINGLCQ
jgi:hypothetical protein